MVNLLFGNKFKLVTISDEELFFGLKQFVNRL